MSAEQFIQGIIGGLAIGCIYSLIALGITMIIRATEILHFAQGELMMIGSMAGLSAMWMAMATPCSCAASPIFLVSRMPPVVNRSGWMTEMPDLSSGSNACLR